MPVRALSGSRAPRGSRPGGGGGGGRGGPPGGPRGGVCPGRGGVLGGPRRRGGGGGGLRARGEGRARLELSPRGDRWAFLAKAELIYDAVGGEVDAELREGYVDVKFPALDLRVGRQVVTWGVG